MSTIAKDFSITLYSDQTSHYSQRVRMVLAEKDIQVDIRNLDPKTVSEELAERIPLEGGGVSAVNRFPTLADRDLLLDHSLVIMEYLDERYPHPPLLPVYPVARAMCRLYIHALERDWCVYTDELMAGKGGIKKLDNARKELRDHVISSEALFARKPFFMSDEFTLVDCCIAPILWRLQAMDIKPTGRTKHLQGYMDRLFSRTSFRESLTEMEQDMRD